MLSHDPDSFVITGDDKCSDICDAFGIIVELVAGLVDDIRAATS